MKQKFNRIILFARQYRANKGVSETLTRLSNFIKKSSLQAYLDEETAESFKLKLPVISRDEMGKEQDLIVVVGGDGSLLSAARLAINVNVPVIGINRGRLGFLTDVSPLKLEEQLGAVLKGEYEEEHRFLLQSTIHDGEKTYYQGDALNDVVLSRGTQPHLIEFDIYINQQFVSHYRSDGMIISTPTGSTAYSLSAGGPIMHPQLDAVVVVPMFSHSLSSRPLVVGGKSKIDLHISESNEAELMISCDGHELRLIKPGQRVTIEKNARQLRLLHPLDYNYYETLRIKLGWESKHQG